VAGDPDYAARAETHAVIRASAPYQAQLQALVALTDGFVQAVRLAWFASTRDPSSPEWLFWRFTDDLLASAIGIARLVTDGVDRPARRELRFMLELVIRNLYVDTQFATRQTPFSARMAYVEHKLGTDDASLLGGMPLSLYVAAPESFKAEVRRLYGELSRFTHPTHEQLAQRLAAAERGVYIGFETAAELESFTNLLRRTYDILLIFVFEALGHDATGDVYIQALDDLTAWPFHATKYTPEVGRTFDHKLERQDKKGTMAIERRQRGSAS
jgi:hypothetical protein